MTSGNNAIASSEIVASSILDCSEYSVLATRERESEATSSDCTKKNPVVRGDLSSSAKLILFPSGKVFPMGDRIVLTDFRETHRFNFERGNIVSLVPPFFDGEAGFDFKELKQQEGHYSLFLDNYKAYFYIPEIGSISIAVEALQGIPDRKRRELSLAYLFLTKGFFSNAIALLWEKYPDSIEANLILAAALQGLAVPVEEWKNRKKAIASFCEKVLLAEFASTAQRKEALALLNN